MPMLRGAKAEKLRQRREETSIRDENRQGRRSPLGVLRRELRQGVAELGGRISGKGLRSWPFL